MKFFNNNLKFIIGFIVGVILAGGIVYAAVSANQIIYTTDKNANIKTVADALNDLYNRNLIDLNNEPETIFGIHTTSGAGTKNDPYIITDENQLAVLGALKNTNNLYFKLGKNLDLKDYCYRVDGTTTNDFSWIIIGTIEHPFNGYFDGSGYTISNIYINTTQTNSGLFGYIGSNGVVTNLTIQGTIANAGTNTGAIAGVNLGEISNCTNNTNITISGSSAGGIVGRNNGIIYRCKNNANISCDGEDGGGIAGDNGYSNGTGFVIECINTGSVNANDYNSGGIVGNNGFDGADTKGLIYNCYNTGSINGGKNNRGGIVGQIKLRGGFTGIYNCYNRGNVNGGSEILGRDWGKGTYENQNNYGESNASVENLNSVSTVDSALSANKYYRNGVWTTKNDNIALDWE